MKNYDYPNKQGWFGDFGGRFVSETLMTSLLELEQAYLEAKEDSGFWQEYRHFCRHYVGRPSPTYFAERLSKYLGGAKIFLKREDLNHTGAHKVNNVLGQILLAKRMGKKRVIAETGAGQHGVASAMVAARFGMECVVFMGEDDIKRQASNVYRMKLLGAQVIGVSNGTRTLKDAMNEAMREWVARVDDTFYVIGTVAGPHPYPQMVRDFQSIISQEARAQILECIGRLPDVLVACIGGGSNAIGFFYHFIPDESVAMVGVEAGGLGLETKQCAATISSHSPIGILHGAKTYLMQDQNGQVLTTHSVSAGLDYPGVGPEHCFLNSIARVKYDSINDDEAVHAFHLLSTQEGIIPALESSHAVAWAIKNAPKMSQDKVIFINLSGRGDKDINTIANMYGIGL
ncbi:MAG: tryptophan synthase subunit beta [Neisseriaceae bacterium]|nr:MAG: tryptophan synthase subunit beta [Neisseriaceae bacterium]